MHAYIRVDADCCCACSIAGEAYCAYEFRSMDHPGVALMYALLFSFPFLYLAPSLICLPAHMSMILTQRAASSDASTYQSRC